MVAFCPEEKFDAIEGKQLPECRNSQLVLSVNDDDRGVDRVSTSAGAYVSSNGHSDDAHASTE